MYYHHHYHHHDHDQHLCNGNPGYYYSHPNEPKIAVRNHYVPSHHVPFAQRILCEPYHQARPQVARVHSFTTRVYLNGASPNSAHGEPLSFPTSTRIVQQHRRHSLRRPPSFAYRYHSAERPIKR